MHICSVTSTDFRISFASQGHLRQQISKLYTCSIIPFTSTTFPDFRLMSFITYNIIPLKWMFKTSILSHLIKLSNVLILIPSLDKTVATFFQWSTFSCSSFLPIIICTFFSVGSIYKFLVIICSHLVSWRLSFYLCFFWAEFTFCV